jgi:hypothetical protein
MISLEVNGKRYELDVGPDVPLRYWDLSKGFPLPMVEWNRRIFTTTEYSP